MEDLNIDVSINVYVSEEKYDECYEYLEEMRSKITREVMTRFNATSESYLD